MPTIVSPGQLGISTPFGELLNPSDARMIAELDDYASLGVDWVRLDIHWDLVQKTANGQYNWGLVDKVFDAVAARGMEVIAILSDDTPWGVDDKFATAADRQAYAEFAAAAAQHFGDRVDHWEIMNEPNMHGISPANYTAALKLAHAAIKAVDADDTVITGGTAAVPSTGNGLWGAVDYLKQMYANGAKGHFDAVGFHPYTYPLMPSDPKAWNGWQIMEDGIRGAMVANGDSGKQVWMTELGAPTRGSGAAMTEAQQAEILKQAVELAQGYSWAGPILWYSYQDRGGATDNKENWFGLLDADGNRKAAYYSFKEFATNDGFADTPPVEPPPVEPPPVVPPPPTFEGDEEPNTIVGDSAANTLRGYGGNDILDGGAGGDTMYGGAGNDTYTVNVAGDVVSESSGGVGLDDGGTDLVNAAVSFTLGDFVENLTLTTAGAVTGIGNARANTITGSAANNTLAGLEGDDLLYGGAGADRLDAGQGNDGLYGGTEADNLIGRSGRDILDGGAGNDTMYGGAGNDTYVVGSLGDVVSESREGVGLDDGGTDLVNAAVSFTLGPFVENLTLTAVGTGTGNALANTITGSAANNTLNGGGGNDTLHGGFGNDILLGGTGNDTFVFDEGMGWDQIRDFVRGDRIDLRAFDADTTASGHQAFQFIGGKWLSNAGDLGFYQDKARGVTSVQGDTDGDNDLDFSIVVQGLHSFTASDFIL